MKRTVTSLCLALAILACASTSSIPGQTTPATPSQQVRGQFEGTVQNRDTVSKTLTVISPTAGTPTGESKVFTVPDDTVITKLGVKKTLADIRRGEAVWISFVNLPDNSLQAQRIIIVPKQEDLRPLEGTVQNLDTASKTLTITTAMGQTEKLSFADDLVVTRQGDKKALGDIRNGEGVRISYATLPDKTLLAEQVMIGYYVAHCSCGSACACPLSRGCRAVRY